MTKLNNPIGIYFTVNACKDLSRYLKGNISHITQSLDLSQMLNIIYNFASDICPSMLYKGSMFRGISSDKRLQSIRDLNPMEWASWSKSEYIALDFAEKNEGQYKYVVVRKGKAIDPATLKDIACTYFDDDYLLTGLETYNPSREREVLAPLIHSECILIDVTKY